MLRLNEFKMVCILIFLLGAFGSVEIGQKSPRRNSFFLDCRFLYSSFCQFGSPKVDELFWLFEKKSQPFQVFFKPKISVFLIIVDLEIFRLCKLVEKQVLIFFFWKTSKISVIYPNKYGTIWKKKSGNGWLQRKA